MSARVILCALLLVAAAPAVAAEKIALFGFEFVNTSLEATRPDETARLAASGTQAGEMFEKAGFEVVDTAPVAAEMAKIASIRDCNGCELKLAQELGAAYAGFGWIQKVSNLILNVNFQVRDATSGVLVAAGTVDIRGNTDESWRRGVRYLLDHRILPR
ncbi:MAG: DUF3280 domain-containing protein [Geminicoccaceae bacterium]